MPNFTLKKKTGFTFALENDEKVYELPSLKKLSLEEGELMAKIDDEKNIKKKGQMVKNFILKYAPDLEKKDVGDMEYFEIFNAYAQSQGDKDLGE